MNLQGSQTPFAPFTPGIPFDSFMNLQGSQTSNWVITEPIRLENAVSYNSIIQLSRSTITVFSSAILFFAECSTSMSCKLI